jgi:hypothetical protein
MNTDEEQKIDPVEKEIIVIEATKKRILRITSIFWLTSTVFLFLRIILEGLGSDPKSVFAAFIYLISSIFLLPFWGIFPNYPNTMQAGKPTFDGPAVTAIFCYTILVLLTTAVVMIYTNMRKTKKQVREEVEKDHFVDPTEAERLIK